MKNREDDDELFEGSRELLPSAVPPPVSAKSTLEPAPPTMRHKFLGWFAEPKDITVGMWLAYCAMTIGGVIVLLRPPPIVSIFSWDHVQWLWPLLWILGGVVGVAFTLQGLWGLERAGIVLLSSGSFLYFLAVINISVIGERVLWEHMAMIVISFFFSWYRFRTIYLHDINPNKA